MAPEMFHGEDYGFSVDYWAFGTLIYEMICGYPPNHSFQKIKESKHKNLIKYAPGKLEFPEGFDK